MAGIIRGRGNKPERPLWLRMLIGKRPQSLSGKLREWLIIAIVVVCLFTFGAGALGVALATVNAIFGPVLMALFGFGLLLLIWAIIRKLRGGRFWEK